MFGNKNKTNESPDYSLYAIYDAQLAAYTDRPPVTAANNVELLRSTQALFMDPQQSTNQLRVHAEHFSIFKIANYDKKTAVITPLVPHEHVVNLIDVRSASTISQRPHLAESGIAPT